MTTGRVHKLKTMEPFWSDVAAGRKRFEVRRNDRGGFAVGDLLELVSLASGQVQSAKVIYVLQGGQFGIAEGYAVLGIENLEQW